MKRILLILISYICVFQIEAQTLININPDNAYQGQSLNLTITGSNTHFTQTSSTIRFIQGSSTIYSDYTSIIDNNNLSAYISFSEYAPIGYYDVLVNNSLDNEITLENAFLLTENPYTPKIVSVNPPKAKQNTTIKLSITGQNTHFYQTTGTILWFNQGSTTIYPNNYNILNNEVIEAYFSFRNSDEVGFYNIYVNDGYDDLLILDNGFELLLDTYIYDFEKNISIYPNPSTGKFKIGQLPNGIYLIEIYDLKGEIIITKNISIYDNEYTVDLPEYCKGIFILSIKNNKSQYIKKLIIK